MTSARAAAGSSVSVSRSTSASTGTAPVCTIASIVAKNVCAGAITSSPGPTPHASSAANSASVPFETPRPWAAPQ